MTGFGGLRVRFYEITAQKSRTVFGNFDNAAFSSPVVGFLSLPIDDHLQIRQQLEPHALI